MNRFATLREWLSWLETLHPKAIDMGLERVRIVAARLGVLAPGVPVVMVGGTNGKGSTTAVLDALLRAHGKRSGCYTSPHILRFNERIRIDGVEVDDAALLAALAQVDAARGDISLTYFEFTTLAAFYLFMQARLDAWVLEVGLGGRLDAVNVIDANVAVLTSVGIDHQEWLGSTRESIGAEKSGIFRARRPVVIGDAVPPRSVMDAVDALAAPAFRVGIEFGIDDLPVAATGAVQQWQWRGMDGAGKPLLLSSLPLPRLALANTATALQAFALLFPMDPAAVSRALQHVCLAGRNQRLDVRGRAVIVDVGHNPDGMRFLSREIARHGVGMRFHIVLGMLADKDVQAAVSVLEPLGQSWHIAPLPSPRSADVEQLRAALAGIGAVFAYAGIADALHAALARDDELPVLVTGSFYTVSEAMVMLEREAAR
jgi:dihydrofolate synthase/folylpolyglutamate synthase